MINVSFFEILGMFIIPFCSILIPILVGQYYGLFVKNKSGKVSDSPVGSVVGAALGLLAFMLAFTFQIVDNRYNSRKELLLDEVTEIRTTYLQSGLIPEPYRSSSRKFLIEYTDLRATLVNDTSIENVQRLKIRSQSILDSLWDYSEALAAQDRSSEAYSLYITSVNSLFDTYNKRVTLTFEYRIPVAILWVLFIISWFSMLLLGYQFGITGKKNNRLAVFISIIFASVMFLILALDRPETRIMKLNQTPVLTLQKQLHSKK
ncbi:hypothetical protein [Flavobacterium sp. MDT1-60]|uniref:bestrophin-like domain n=1 Tax=Flavobacterium sp. MDT1-60 TaxID=1979344 RepID=UPI00178271A5|nr:hypothetical protein [Flavobacterium sp. MDT1-60]QOG04288.1 hypothetical protein IHE43_08805 [Flavobacterium sp. MDT1-60]